MQGTPLCESGGDQSHQVWAMQLLCGQEIWLWKNANQHHYPVQGDHNEEVHGWC